MATRAEAIDLVTYAINDTEQYRRGDRNKETAADSVRAVLAEVMDKEPTAADVDAVLDS